MKENVLRAGLKRPLEIPKNTQALTAKEKPKVKDVYNS